MNAAIRELTAVVDLQRRRLEAVHTTLEGALTDEITRLGKTPVSALIIAGLLENYYTCLETIFLRISQHFENRLGSDRWHRDLLQKMTLEIKGVRGGGGIGGCLPPALATAPVPPLQAQLLRIGI